MSTMLSAFVAPVSLRASAYLKRYLCTRRSTPPRCALAVQILHMGRRSGKDALYDDAVEVYTTRLSSTLRITEKWGVSATEVDKLSAKNAVVLLTEDGHMPKCSVAFSEFVYSVLAQSKSRAAFVIGADDGIPDTLRGNGRMHKLSLGPLTLTHKMARLVLVEQLYRASTIRAGGKYHRV